MYSARVDLGYALWPFTQGTFVTPDLDHWPGHERERGMSGLRPSRGPWSSTNRQEGDLSAK